MPSIVADTTPLNYLILIQAVEVLPKLYGNVLIPSSVRTELSDPQAPALVREWIIHSPEWLQVVALQNSPDASLSHLDAGERDAIHLALEQRAARLLMDEREGSAAARSLGLTVIGTLGVLEAASTRRWLDLSLMFDRLRQTTFRSPARLIATMLEQDAARKKNL